MKKYMTLTGVTAAALLWGTGQNYAQQAVPPNLALPGAAYMVPNYANSPVLTKFKDPLPGVSLGGAAVPSTIIGPVYFNSAVGGVNIPIAQAEAVLPAGVPAVPACAYYEIALVDYNQTLHSDMGPTKLRGYVQIYPPSAAAQPAGSTQLFYVDSAGNPTTTPITVNIGTVAAPINVNVYAYQKPTYLGPIILATKGVPTRIKFYNLLPAGAAGDLFIPTDITFAGAGTGPDGVTLYSQNRATLHLHGGDNPWISDGTALQWITPAGQAGNLTNGVSQRNVPDMPAPQKGAATFFWPNGESARLMFYHDHAKGMTRLNPYAGEAAGYLLVDGTEATLNAFAPGGEIPLVIQEKAFVNDVTPPPAGFPALAAAPVPTAVSDPLWVTGPWGQTKGSLWWPHVYMPNQNPNDISGANPFGRWDYGAWFWPIFPSGIPPAVSAVPETFVDTPIVNGTAYPVLNVSPMAYRLRILNAANDRYWNLQLYKANTGIISSISGGLGGSGYTSPSIAIVGATGRGATAVATVDPVTTAITAIDIVTVGSGYTAPVTVTITDPNQLAAGASLATANLYIAPTEVGMVPASKTVGIGFPAWWQANDTPGMTPNVLDSRPGGVPDPAMMGPSFIHIGSEGGLSPSAVVMQTTPIGFEQNKRSVTVLNTYEHTLFLGPAERADVIVDFSQFAGQTLIMYNDAPAPLPGGDPRNDYYTSNPDMVPQGGAPPTQPGFGPNTRTIMQIVVGGTANGTAIDQVGLNTAVATAFAANQPAAIVPPNTYARISDTSMTLPAPLGTVPLQPKTIQELFDPLGRMNSTLGVEVPFTTATIQTTIPYGFLDPATEVIADGDTQLWKITHNGVDTHAIHFHLFNVQVINRVGWDGAIKPPWPEELGWKETVKMNPLEDIVVAMRIKVPTVPFAQANNTRALDPNVPLQASTVNMNGTIAPIFTGVDPAGNPVTVANVMANFGNEYTWHCHLLGHEENDMMRAVCVAVAPQPPTGLVQTTSKGSLVLVWQDNSPDETGYMVQKKVGTAGWTTIGTTTNTTFTDTTFKKGQAAQYQVIAVNTVGSGVPGYPSVTAYSLPSNVAAAPLGTTTITSVTQALPVASPVVVKWTYSATDQTGFTVERSTSNTFGNGTTTFTVPGTQFAQTNTITGLKKSTTYFYRVTPTNTNGSGSPSNIASLLVHP